MPAPKKPKLRRIRVRRGLEKVSDGVQARELEAKAAALLARDAPLLAPPAPPAPSDAPPKPALKAIFVGALNTRGELELASDAPKEKAPRRSSRTSRRR